MTFSIADGAKRFGRRLTRAKVEKLAGESSRSAVARGRHLEIAPGVLRDGANNCEDEKRRQALIGLPPIAPFTSE
jgi:hypothetical protein